MEDNLQHEKPLEITEQIKNDLLNSAKWGKFLAIVGYVFMGIIAIFGIFFLFRNAPNPIGVNLPLQIMGVVYLIMAVVYYFPVTYLYRYAKSIKEALLDADQDSLTDGFYNLNKMFTFMGILTIIALVINALIIMITGPMMFLLQR